MNSILIYLFLFSVGSLIGWCIELFFRRFVSNRATKKWVNPGFLTGPWLPLYGSGQCVLYAMASIHFPAIAEKNPLYEKLLIILFMAIAMTVIEYITGLIFIKGMHVMLWDYSNRKWNIQGIICPIFSLFWGILGAAYYILIHPHVLSALDWLSRNLAFSFFIGLFYGIFIMDCVYSFHLVAKIKALADEYEIIVKYNELKEHLIDLRTEAEEKQHFFFFFNMQRIKKKTPFDIHQIYAENKERFSVSRLKEKISESLESKHSK